MKSLISKIINTISPDTQDELAGIQTSMNAIRQAYNLGFGDARKSEKKATAGRLISRMVKVRSIR
jgi:hypothetical protein